MDERMQGAADAIKANVESFLSGAIDRPTFDACQSAVWAHVDALGPDARAAVSREVCPL